MLLAIAFFALALIGGAGAQGATGAARQDTIINQNWTFYLGDRSGAQANNYDDSAWQSVNLPHSFSLPYFLSTEWYSGYGWYRKHIAMPSNWAGQRIFVEFEGAFQDAQIYVNGTLVGEHLGGFSGFYYDITNQMAIGDNVLAVRLNSAWNAQLAPRAGDYAFNGGITRNVHLVVTSPLHVTWYGTFVTTPVVSSTAATVAVQTEVRNDGATASPFTLQTDIVDPNGATVATLVSSGTANPGTTGTYNQTSPTLANPMLWHPDHPSLYRALTTLSMSGSAVDTYSTTFGIRSIQWTASQGFFLNGSHYEIYGANVHGDRAGWANATTNAGYARDVGMVKGAGFNFIRGSHYPKPPAFAEACDQLGVLFWSENCFWGIGGGSGDGTWTSSSAYPPNAGDQPAFDQSVRDSLAAMIRVNRNHPSIIAWSMCNEAFFCDSAVFTKMRNLLSASVALSHQLDSTRPAAIGGAQRPMDSERIDLLGDVAGYNGDGATQPAFQNPGIPSMVTEYGSPSGERPGSYDGAWGSVASASGNTPVLYPWRAGQCLWCAFDHGSGGKALEYTGMIDFFRLPLENWYWYRNYFLGVPPPAWPSAGTPAKLQLTADKTTLQTVDGTDDAQLTVSIQDAAGHLLSNTASVTLTITSGPGEFPTGRSITFTPAGNGDVSDIAMTNGQAAIEFRAYQSGTTVIEATSPGLTPASITISSAGSPAFVPGVTPLVADRPYQRYVGTPVPYRSTTLALNRPTGASSIAAGSAASYANDGNASTVWTAADTNPRAWWQVCLEANYQVTWVQLTFPSAGNYQYKIQVSTDGSNWRTAVDQSQTTSTDQTRFAAGNFGAGITFVRVQFTGLPAGAPAGLADVVVGGGLNLALKSGQIGGTIIGTGSSWGNVAANAKQAAFDGNTGTFFDGPDASGDWVGLDLGSNTKARISAVSFYPRSGFAARMVGGTIQGANRPDFSDAVTLATIGSSPSTTAYSTLAVSNTNSFECLRYVSPESGNCNLAEIQFYQSLGWPSSVTEYEFENKDASDSSGSGNTGTASGVTYVAGKVGNWAANFDGNTAYVETYLSSDSDFSVAMWVKTTGGSSAGTSASQWWAGKGLVDASSSGFAADWGTSIVNGQFAFGVGPGESGSDTTILSPTAINDNNWHHVAATWNEATGLMAAYVDGALAATGTAAAGVPRFSPIAAKLGQIGPNSGSDTALNGALDDVRFFNRVLSASEVAALATGSATATAPSAPQNLSATAGLSQITLTWDASSGASSYVIERSLSSGTGYTVVGTTDRLSFCDTTAIDGTNYFYAVVACNLDGSSSSSSVVPAAAGAPAAPANLVATSGTGTSVQLAWTPVPNATSYTVLASSVSGGPYAAQEIGIANAGATIGGLDPGVTYYFVVRACNSFGTGACSSEASATTPAATGGAPFQAALNASNVVESDLSNISSKGLVVGNGELNAIVYSSGSDLRLRVSKNDCWDMRINTSGDGAMPIVNPATGAFTNSSTPSWGYPYPTALPCTDITLAAVNGQTSWLSAQLDLLKAAATVFSDADATTVRVLSQSNVILINSPRTISLGGVSGIVTDNGGASISSWVSPAESGTQSGYTFLHQNIPGDADASGMDIYVVLGRSGSTQAIAVVTSRDSATPLSDAAALVTNTLADANAIATHEAAWQSFWAKSGVSLGDASLQKWWYRMVYFFRCFARANGNVIGLQACLDKLGGWHNSLTLNYNAEQTQLAAGPINHPELAEPFVNVLNRNLNRAKWFATTNFIGAEGAYFHDNLWPFEPDPANCTTKNKHQLAYIPWGYTWGTAGHETTVLWDYYRFNPSAASLNRVYPLLKQFALFYCSILEKCSVINGKIKIGPSYFPENGSYGQYNVCYDIAFINYGMKAAHEAATLQGETTLASRISNVLGQMPAYTTANDTTSNVNGTIIEEWLGSGVQNADNHGTSVQAIFPAEEISWASSQSDKDLFTRTIQHVENVTGHSNSNVTINIARARLGLGTDAINNAKLCFGSTSAHSPEQPNGLFYWKNHGYYITEQVCIARLVSELLMQSVGNVIRIFPAWPASTDAHFSKLLAIGGFQVSADQTSGVIGPVAVTSNCGGTASVQSPWGSAVVSVTNQTTGACVAYTAYNNIIRFATTAGQTYVVANQSASGPASLTATPASSSQVNLAWTAGNNATSYIVSRATAVGGPFTTIATNVSGTSYSDTGAPSNTTLAYVVTSANSFGTGGNSPEADLGLAPTGLAAAGGNALVTLTWSAPGAPGATGYQVKRATASGGPYTTIASGIASTSYTDNTAANNTTYFYAISGLLNGFEGANSAQAAGFPAAGTDSWAASASSGNWATGGNWAGGAAPANNVSLNFGASSQTSLTNNISNLTVESIGFNAGASAFSLSGNAFTLLGGIVNLSGTGQSISANITLGNTVVVNAASGGITLGGVVGDGGNHYGIIKTGSDVLTLCGANTFNGGTTLNAGTLVFTGSAGAVNYIGTGALTLNGGTMSKNTAFGTDLIIANALNVTGSTVLSAQTTGNWLLTGTVTGNGTINVSNAGSPVATTIFINGDLSSFSGTLAQTSGNNRLRFGVTNSGPTTIDLSHATVSTAGSTTSGNPVDVADSTYGTVKIGQLVGTGGIIRAGWASAGNTTFQVGFSNTNTTYAGDIQDNPNGSNGLTLLTKVGTGSLTLAGANTYTGATTISSGALYVNGSLTAASAVSVASGAVLGGSGNVGGPVTVASGGSISPGANGSGVLTLSGSLILNVGSSISMQLGVAGFSPSLALNKGFSAGGNVTINVAALPGFGPGVYPLIASSTLLNAANFALGSTPAGSTCSLSASGGALYLTVDAPGAPSGLSATTDDGTVFLAWNPATYAASYTLKRASTSGGPYSVVGNFSGTLGADTGLVNGAAYYYVVVANNAAGSSTPSTELMAIPSAPIGIQESRTPLMTMTGAGANTTISFAVASTALGHTYQLQYRSSLSSGTWTNLGSPQAGTGAAVNLSVPIDIATSPSGFYRILIQR